jgi:hypothetical protein
VGEQVPAVVVVEIERAISSLYKESMANNSLVASVERYSVKEFLFSSAVYSIFASVERSAVAGSRKEIDFEKNIVSED